jgi:hypothetical protein
MASDEIKTPASETAPTEPEATSGSFLDRAKKAREQIASKIGELKDAGLDKVLETIDDFNSALPVIAEAGYALSDVNIGLGLPPMVSASFRSSDDVSPEKVEKLLEEHADKKFTLLLMKSLYQAWQLQQKIKIVGLKPKGISVVIGLIPVVTIKFA